MIVLGALVAEGGARTCVFKLSDVSVCFACSISASFWMSSGWLAQVVSSLRVHVAGWVILFTFREWMGDLRWGALTVLGTGPVRDQFCMSR